MNRNQGAESTLAFLHTEVLNKELQLKLAGTRRWHECDSLNVILVNIAEPGRHLRVRFFIAD